MDGFDFLLPDLDEDGIPFMPCFEGSEGEDRPFAPSAEDYPIGCEVELRDIDVAKVAQTPENWEAVMDEIFSVPRRRVIVRRHLGDYSFVICNDQEGFEAIGVTLYRACLGEPKVKTTKYYSTMATADASRRSIEDMDDKELHEEIKLRMSIGNAAMLRTTEATAHYGGDGDDRTSNPTVATVRHRNKFAIAMKFGTRELKRQKYEKAIRYYNLALEEAPEEEARVVSSRSVAYCYLQQTDLALRDAYRAIELQPENCVGYVRAGNIFRGRKQFDEAKSFYKKALERSPNDEQLQKLYADNCVAMLYALRTKKCPKLKVTHNLEFGRALVVASHPIRNHEVILSETTSLTAMLHEDGSPDGCANCCRPFLNAQSVSSCAADLTPELIQTLYPAVTRISCQYCRVSYCSDTCRSRAWGEHHWVECRGRGRWRRGLREMDKYLREYTGQVPAYDSRENPATSTSPKAVAACVRIAVRMMSRMSSCVWELKDAVEMYNWLQISSAVKGRRSDVSFVLRNCYQFIESAFNSDEKSNVSYDLFERCYERAKTNAIILQTSVWSKLAHKASDQLQIIRESNEPSESQIGSHSEAEKRARALETIIKAPSMGLPGSFINVLCVFELHALTISCAHPPHSIPTPPPSHCRHLSLDADEPNVAITSYITNTAAITLQSMKTIDYGSIIICNPNISTYHP